MDNKESKSELEIGVKIIFLKDIYFNNFPEPDICKGTVGTIKEVYKLYCLVQFFSLEGTWAFQIAKNDLDKNYRIYDFENEDPLAIAMREAYKTPENISKIRMYPNEDDEIDTLNRWDKYDLKHSEEEIFPYCGIKEEMDKDRCSKCVYGKVFFELFREEDV